MKTFTAILSLAVFLTLPAEAGEWRYEAVDDPSGLTKGRIRYHSEFFDNTPNAYAAFTMTGAKGDTLFLTLRVGARHELAGKPNYLGWAYEEPDEGLRFVPLSQEGWGSESYKVRCAVSGEAIAEENFVPCGPQAGPDAWLDFLVELRPAHWEEYMAGRNDYDMLWIDMDNGSLYLDLAGFAEAMCEHVAPADHDCHDVRPAPPVAGAAVEPTDETRYAIKNSNVRDAPGTHGAKMAVLPKGSAVTVTGIVQGADWVRIAMDDGRTGYIFANLLGEDAPASGSETTGAEKAGGAGLPDGWFEPENTYEFLKTGGAWIGTTHDGCDSTLTLSPYTYVDVSAFEWIASCANGAFSDSGNYALYFEDNWISLPADALIVEICAVFTNDSDELMLRGGCRQAGTYTRQGDGYVTLPATPESEKTFEELCADAADPDLCVEDLYCIDDQGFDWCVGGASFF